MERDRIGQTVVLFVSRRRLEAGALADPAGYDEAASHMEALAAQQPGFRGIESTRGADGVGITVSYWTDDAAARAWRDQPDHAATREAGRARWYDDYALTVATVTRGYAWRRSGG